MSLYAKVFPHRFARHSLATHLSGVFAIEPRPLRLAAEQAKGLLAKVTGAEIREMIATPRAERPSLLAADMQPPRMDGAAELEPASYAARILVRGVIVNGDASCARMLGADATGLDEIAHALDVTIEDPEVSEIVIDVCSPGGTATGLMAIVSRIVAGRAIKPIRAEISGQCASAAYKLICACTEIAAEESALVGSIGTYSVIEDSSKAFEAEGVAVHVVRSAPHKGVGEPGSSVTPAHLAAIQTVVDDLAGLFTRTISEHRGLDAEQTKAIATGEVWIASKALERKLIDRVGIGAREPSPEARASTNTNPAPPGAITEVENMAHDKPAAVAVTGQQDTIEGLRAQLAQIQAEAETERAARERAEAVVASFAAAKATANRERLTRALETHAKAGTFAPAERPTLEALAARFADDPEAFERHLETRAAVSGKVSRPTPAGVTPEPPDGTAEIAEIEAQIAAALRVPVARVIQHRDVTGVGFDNSLETSTGAVRRFSEAE